MEVKNDINFGIIIDDLKELSAKLQSREEEKKEDPYYSAILHYLHDLLVYQPKLKKLEAKFNDLLIDCISENQNPKSIIKEFDILVVGIKNNIFNHGFNIPNNYKPQEDLDKILEEVGQEVGQEIEESEIVS